MASSDRDGKDPDAGNEPYDVFRYGSRTLALEDAVIALIDAIQTVEYQFLIHHRDSAMAIRQARQLAEAAMGIERT